MSDSNNQPTLEADLLEVRQELNKANEYVAAGNPYDLKNLETRITDLTARLTSEISEIPETKRPGMIEELMNIIRKIETLEIAYHAHKPQASNSNTDTNSDKDTDR